MESHNHLPDAIRSLPARSHFLEDDLIRVDARHLAEAVGGHTLAANVAQTNPDALVART